jgi:hypothetical protein
MMEIINRKNPIVTQRSTNILENILVIPLSFVNKNSFQFFEEKIRE